MARILIVDDEISIRETLSEFMREEGYQVESAEDADAALDTIARDEPDVVVTDIILPRVTGVELLREIHEIAPDVQVVMITGEPTAETAAEAVRLGAFDYLPKPIVRTDFKASVASALRVSQLARRKRQLEQENLRYQEHLEEEVAKKTTELRTSEAKYRAVVETAGEAVFILQGIHLKFVNAMALKIIGYSREKLLSIPFLDLVYPDDREMAAHRYARRMAGEDVPDEYELRIVTAKDETRWIEIRPVLVSWEGRPGTLNLASDITERKRIESALRESENRFRRLFELSPYSMVYLDLDGTIILCNNRFTELHATRGGAQEQTGRSIFEFFSDDEQDRIRSIMEQAIASEGRTESTELVMLREIGEPFYAEAVGTLVRDKDGQPAAILALAIDVTERKHAEHAERERQAKIRRSNEALLELATRRDVYEGRLEAAFHAITEMAAAVLDVAQVGIWLLDEDRTVIRCVDMYYAAEDAHRPSRDYATSDLSVYLAALDAQRVFTVTDVYTDAQTTEFDLDALRSEGVASIMNASIRAGGQSIGDISFEHAGAPREWTHEDAEFAGSIADLIALTVESSQRLKIEEALRMSEEKHRAVVEYANDAIFVVDGDKIAFANPEAQKIAQRTEHDLRSRCFIELVYPEDRELVLTSYGDVFNGAKERIEFKARFLHPNGDVRWLAVRGVRISWEGRHAVLCFANDITLHIQAERREAERQERIRRGNEALLQLATQHVLYEGDLEPAFRIIAETAADVLEVSQVAIWLLNTQQDLLECLESYVASERLHRRGRDYRCSDIANYLGVLEKHRVLSVTDLQNDSRMREFDLESMAAEGIVSVLDAAVRSGGCSIGDICFEHAGELRQWTHEEEEFASEVASLVALTVESSQRRQAETALERREKEYETLFENSPVSLWYEDFSDAKLYLDDLRKTGVTDLRTHLVKHPEVLGQCIDRIRVIDINEMTVAMYEATSKEDLTRNYRELLADTSRSSVVEQLIAVWNGDQFFEATRIDRTVKGNERQVVIRWVVSPGHGDTFDRVLLAKTDISAVIEAEQALRKALDGTIEAIGLTTETRDPYTAGHQRRVTKLAEAIAIELGLDAEVVEGTRAAGLLHDIGKMAIPAEILSKPSQLTEMEMALIRSHPRVAYDILKPVSFPWPLAEIVHQHHERLDGSGYPQGLRGDEILMEARILAVADTVEAMASHRPYRAAVGIDAALEVIEASRGTSYDADVVDVCLSLFREDRFRFEDDR